MNKTVYTGLNQDACILIKPDNKYLHGNTEEIAELLQVALTDAILENPQLRRPVVKAMRSVRFRAMHEILRYWLEGWPFTVVGCAALFGALYGFAALMQAVGA
jgi:hypothetical protein